MTAAATALPLGELVVPGGGPRARAEDSPFESVVKVQRDMKVGYDNLKRLVVTLSDSEKAEFCKDLGQACSKLIKSTDTPADTKKALQQDVAKLIRLHGKLADSVTVSDIEVSVVDGKGVVTAKVKDRADISEITIDDSRAVQAVAKNSYMQRVNEHRSVAKNLDGVVDGHMTALPFAR